MGMESSARKQRSRDVAQAPTGCRLLKEGNLRSATKRGDRMDRSWEPSRSLLSLGFTSLYIFFHTIKIPITPRVEYVGVEWKIPHKLPLCGSSQLLGTASCDTPWGTSTSATSAYNKIPNLMSRNISRTYEPFGIWARIDSEQEEYIQS